MHTDTSQRLNRILITGATGFIGNALGKTLSKNEHYQLHAIVRKRDSSIDWAEKKFISQNFSDISVEDNFFNNIDVVIHCAGRAHVMKEDKGNPLEKFRKVNVQDTLNVARLAANAGVRRFIFISSIKVNGEYTNNDTLFTPEDVPDPRDSYGISKFEAELSLRKLSRETDMEIVIVRPVLVYGPGVKANFLNAIKLVSKQIPLPLGSIHNKRSMVFLGNLVDFIATCINHPAAANQTFIAADAEDISTTTLFQKIASGLKLKAFLIPAPKKLILFLLKLLYKENIAQRLFGSLQVDTSKNQLLLGWRPPFSVDEGIECTIKYYLANSEEL